MADAWGKLPSGILSGNLYELGNFDQCLSIDQFVPDAGTVKGQYCLATVALNLNRSNKNFDNIFSGGLENMLSRESLKQPSMVK